MLTLINFIELYSSSHDFPFFFFFIFKYFKKGGRRKKKVGGGGGEEGSECLKQNISKRVVCSQKIKKKGLH